MNRACYPRDLPGHVGRNRQPFWERLRVAGRSDGLIGWMVEAALRTSVARIVLNGSFTTDLIEPNDVDCVLLFLPGHPRDTRAIQELRGGLPFLDIKLVGPEDFDDYENVTFGTDRAGVPKGMLEVIL